MIEFTKEEKVLMNKTKEIFFKASNWTTIEKIYISINTRLQIKRKDLFRNKETKDQGIDE